MFILPSISCDLKIIMYNSACKRVPASLGAAVAAAGFLVSFRGLPLDEVDIEADGEKFNVRFSDHNEKVSIILPKCKQILEKSYIFSGNIEKSIRRLEIESLSINLVAAETGDIDLFDESHLRELLLIDVGASLALCYSADNEGIKTKSRSTAPIPDMAPLSALAVFVSRAQRESLTFINGEEVLTLKKTYEGIRASLSPPRFMRFETPYL